MTNWKDGLPDEWGFARYGESPYYTTPPGLRVLAEAELFDEAYQFDLVVVWQDTATGDLLGAADSGCSCPTPFGDLTREGMKPIREVADLEPLIAKLTEYREPTQATALADLKAKVHRALRDGVTA